MPSYVRFQSAAGAGGRDTFHEIEPAAKFSAKLPGFCMAREIRSLRLCACLTLDDDAVAVSSRLSCSCGEASAKLASWPSWSQLGAATDRDRDSAIRVEVH